MGRDGCCPQEPGSARAFLRHSGFGRWVGALHTTSDRSLVFPRSCRRNNVFEFVSEHHPNFPGELLSKVSGENIFQDENVVVSVSAGRQSLPGCCGDGWPAGSAGHPRLPPGAWPRWVFCPTKEDRARPIYLKSLGELFIIGWQEPVEISAMYQELGPGTDCLSPRAVTQCQASVVNTLHLVLLSPSGSERCFSI